MGGYVCALSLGTKGLLHSRQWGAADRSRMKEYTWNENPLSAMNSDSRTREARNFFGESLEFQKGFYLWAPALESPFDAKITPPNEPLAFGK